MRYQLVIDHDAPTPSNLDFTVIDTYSNLRSLWNSINYIFTTSAIKCTLPISSYDRGIVLYEFDNPSNLYEARYKFPHLFL